MSSLHTEYMGITLKNPIIAGASGLTSRLDSIKKLEDSGIGAIVAKSLFEEQIMLERYRYEGLLHKDDDLHAEMQTIFPDLEHAGPEEHLNWIRKTKETVSIPVIGSLNAVQPETWIEYAEKLEQSGVDGLELNFYSLPTEFGRGGAEIEKEQIETAEEVVKKAGVPVSVKISPYYTNPLNFIKRLDDAGVAGLILFNRLFQPSINIAKNENDYSLNLSGANDYRLSLRFAGMLHGKVKASICSSNGIQSTDSLIKVLLAGADAVQMVSALYAHSIVILPKILGELMSWMDERGYKQLDDFRGSLSYEKNPDPQMYTRAQYAKALLHPDKYILFEQ
ncbi:MAG: dihydroorotate dehydrogenase-like protein [Spirochaetia bacterium]